MEKFVRQRELDRYGVTVGREPQFIRREGGRKKNAFRLIKRRRRFTAEAQKEPGMLQVRETKRGYGMNGITPSAKGKSREKLGGSLSPEPTEEPRP